MAVRGHAKRGTKAHAGQGIMCLSIPSNGEPLCYPGSRLPVSVFHHILEFFFFESSNTASAPSTSGTHTGGVQ